MLDDTTVKKVTMALTVMTLLAFLFYPSKAQLVLRGFAYLFLDIAGYPSKPVLRGTVCCIANRLFIDVS